MSDPTPNPPRRVHPALPGLAALAGATVLSQFIRAANGVIAPDLMRDFGFGPEAMGVLTGVFFAAFAVMQLPVGMSFDRFGVRRTIAAMMIVSVAGALVFAWAEALTGLVVGRTLMGLGLAGTLMAGFQVAARWFPQERFGRVAARYASVSALGNTLATAPFAAAVVTVGWRATFVAAAIGLGIAALCVGRWVRDSPVTVPRPRESLGQILGGVREAFGLPGFWPVATLSFTVLGVSLSVTALWAGPYLADVHGLDTVERGYVLMAVTSTAIAGTMFWGTLERWVDSRKRIAAMGGCTNVISLTLLTLWPSPSLPVATGLLVLFAFTASYGVGLTAHGRTLYPDRLMGRGMTAINFIMVVGIAAMQSATGVLIGLFGRSETGAAPEIAYRAVFLFLGLVTVGALLIYRRSPDSRVRATAAPAATQLKASG
jgi:MFS family permease